MRRRERPRAACAGLLFLSAAVLSAAAFTATASAQTPAPAAQTTRADVDEDFELNIDLRRITETNFQAATAVEAGGEGGLRLRIGVELRADSIEVMLRNVRGRVRFRASLAPVLRLLEARPARQTQPPASP